LYADHPVLGELVEAEIIHILTFEPALIAAMDNFLDSVDDNDIKTMLAIHGLFSAQMCVDQQNSGLCTPQDYPNNFTAIYNFHAAFGATIFAGISSNLANIQQDVYQFVLSNTPLTTVQGQGILEYLVLVLNGQFIGQSLTEFVGNYITLKEDLDPVFDFSTAEEDWLLFHPDIIQQIHDFNTNNQLENPSAVTEAVDFHLGFLMIDDDYYQLNAEFAAVPGFMWPFFREIAVEFAIEVLKKNLPGVSDYQNVVDAIKALNQGDMLGLVGEILDILKKKFPAVAAWDLVWDGYDMGKQAKKAFEAVKKLEKFGSSVIEKLLGVVKNHAGKLIGKFKWKSGVGIEMSDIASPEGFFDDFQDALGSIFSDLTILTPPQLAQYELAGFKCNNNVIKVTIKYGGNTNPNGYTLELKYANNPPIKLRFL
jgi:hypothetical protein